MLLFAHHMAVEILGREFSPHGVIEHICVFAALGFVVATSVYGTWTLLAKAAEAKRIGRGV
jgi:hypothetical protein